MTQEQWLVTALLLLVLTMFAWGRWRHDLVAMSALVIAVLIGLVPVGHAFAGFGHPAVVTVAAVLVISHALKNAGVVDLISGKLAPLTTRPLLHIAALTAVVTVASAFMNNVGALALMLPVAIATARQHGRSPALLLMPLAFGSILGGMTTLIGTPPNIIIATIRSDLTGEAPFALFDFAPVGLPVAVAGFIFVVLIGWRLLPRERLETSAPDQLYDVGEYLTEMRVSQGSSLIDRYLRPVMLDEEWEIQLVGLVRAEKGAQRIPPGYRFQEGDILIASGRAEDLQPVMDHYGLELMTASELGLDQINPEDLEIYEGIVSTESSLVNRNIYFLRRESGGNLALLGISRRGRALRKRLRHIRFSVGDVLLLQGRRDDRDEQLGRFGLLPLAPRELSLGQKRRAGLSLVIFAAAISLGLFKLMPLHLAFLLAIAAYLAIGVLPVHRLYDEIDWPVIVLLGAMIPVGKALNILARLGSGFDIVSVGELERVLAAGGDPAKVVFSGVGKRPDEMLRALELGIHCFNIESEAELEILNQVALDAGKAAPVSLRVNPDVDAGTHPYISTGLRENKFGVPVDEAKRLYHKARDMEGLNLVGIDCHIGSQLTELTPFLDALDRVLALVDELAADGIQIRHIDLGGGLGVPYTDEQPPLPHSYAEAIRDRISKHDLEVILEPGRAIAANAGILLTRVEYLKPTEEKDFAIVDAAMNDLLRPSLYSAIQQIIPADKNAQGRDGIYDIVGPVCETGDFLGKQRKLSLAAGDLLAVRSSGAYGFTMSSNYNSRPRAAEVIVDGDKVYLVRERETIESLYAGEHVLP